MKGTSKKHNTFRCSSETPRQEPDGQVSPVMRDLMDSYSCLFIGETVKSVEWLHENGIIFLIMENGKKIMIEPIFVGDDFEYAGLCCVLQNSETPRPESDGQVSPVMRDLMDSYSCLFIGESVKSVEWMHENGIIFLIMESGKKIMIEPIFVGDDFEYAGLCCVLQNVKDIGGED